MTEQRIQQNLEKLRAELDKIGDTDAQVSERINRLINEIEQGFVEVQNFGGHKLMDNITETITQFEAEHPRTTAILNDIMVTLSNMGI